MWKFVCFTTLLLRFGSDAQDRECDVSRPCPEGSSCHPTEYVCYVNPSPVDRPYIWMGNPPNHCTRTAKDCSDLFGMEYDSSHPRGDEGTAWCSEGAKIRCLSRKAPPLTDSPANHFKMASFNVFERDFFISHDGQRERTCRVPRWFAEHESDVDVIAFQETFMGGCWHTQTTLRDILHQHGFRYFTSTVSHPLIVTNGGIFLASKWPIIEEDQHVYKAVVTDTWDRMAAKGVSYAKIKKTVDGESRMYHVMSTHFQAGGFNGNEIRQKQALEWRDMINSKNISGEAVLFAGDLNTDHYGDQNQLKAVMDNLEAVTPEITGDVKYPTDYETNDLLKEKNSKGQKWLDYVLYSKDHLQPKEAEMYCVIPSSDKPFPVCWCDECIPLRGYKYPDHPRCKYVANIRHFADHHPVIGKFVF